MPKTSQLASLLTFRGPSVPAILTPCRAPSNAILPKSRAHRNLEDVLYLNFPSGWGSGAVHEWYRRRNQTAIKKLELRKEFDTFQHEYILVQLVYGFTFRIDRRPDPSVPMTL
jgi:hypothetical protein